MISRAVIIATIVFWALSGGADVFAQGGDPAQPDRADSTSSEEGERGDSGDTDNPEAGPEDADLGETDADETDTGDAGKMGADTDSVGGTGDSEKVVDTVPSDTGTDKKTSELSTSGDETMVDRNAAEQQNIQLIQQDVVPSVIVYQDDKIAVRMGGLVQAHFAPYVGNDSLVDNDDTATSEGFRLRRARLGVEGDFGDDFSLRMVINPLQSDPDVGAVSSARLTYTPLSSMYINVGTDSVPFTRSELESSATLGSIERPLVARTIVPGRRLGATVGGTVASRLGYIVSVMNGTEGYEEGNRFGGFLYAARLELNAVGRPSEERPQDFGLAISMGGLYDDGPATRGLAASADIFLTVARLSAKLEVACDRHKPQNAPEPAPGLADQIERCGAYAELGYTFPQAKLQPVVRFEYFDDNREIEDAGDSLLFSVGVNAKLRDYTRVQLHYLSRRERFSDNRANDAVVMNLQGDF